MFTNGDITSIFDCVLLGLLHFDTNFQLLSKLLMSQILTTLSLHFARLERFHNCKKSCKRFTCQYVEMKMSHVTT